MAEELSSEEKKALQEYLGVGAPVPEEKHNVHTFLFKVATSSDTTKTGYLTAEEVGEPKLPIRAYKELALISDRIIDNDFFKQYYEAKSEIVTSTSLSKDAKLLELAVIQKKEIADVTKPRKINKGWFKSKKKGEFEVEET